MLRLGGIVFLAAIVLLAIPGTKVYGAILLIYSIILMGLSPWLLRMLYLGKFWDQQCWFFGFEGYMDIDTIESQIFGGRMGRLRWTPAASPLSRHHRNEYGECVPDDPTSDPAVAAMVQKAKSAGPGEQRIFTLVDTGKPSVAARALKVALTLLRQHDCNTFPRRASTRMLPNER